jgi:hypothetical protein
VAPVAIPSNFVLSAAVIKPAKEVVAAGNVIPVPPEFVIGWEVDVVVPNVKLTDVK